MIYRLVLVLTGVLICMTDIPWLIKHRMKRELIIFSLLLFAGMVYAVIYVLDIPHPSLMMGFMRLFHPVIAVLDKWWNVEGGV